MTIDAAKMPKNEEVPIPDPTARTLDVLRREIMMLREIIEQRLDGNDKAITILQTQMERDPKPPVLAADIAHTKEMLEKLGINMDTRLTERDKRNEQAVRDSKTLIDNTIQAVKDAFAKQNETSQNAITKSESAAAKQMDQIESKFGTEIGALNGKIDDIKTRITTLESMKLGQKELKDDNKNAFGYIVGAIGVAVSLITVMFLIYSNAADVNDIRGEVARQLQQGSNVSPQR